MNSVLLQSEIINRNYVCKSGKYYLIKAALLLKTIFITEPAKCSPELLTEHWMFYGIVLIQKCHQNGDNFL